jgi:hypothetical protein
MMPVKYRAVAGRAMHSQWGSTALPTTYFGGGYESIDSGTNNLSFLGRVDVGGPMLLKRSMMTYTPGKWLPGDNAAGSDAVMTYWTLPLPSYTVRSDSAVKGDGATLLSKSTPNSPLFSAATFLGELRNDGLPTPSGVQLWREHTKVARGAGAEFLNYEFGWRPFVHDLRNFAKAVKGASKHVQDFTSKQTSLIRVSHGTDTQFSNRTDQGTAYVYLPVDSGHSVTTPATVTSEYGERVWFKGAFRYYAPAEGPLKSVAEFERNANHILGARLTPEVVWNLAPWSWALDWFGNVGDVMHNLSTIGHDGMPLLYGYVMSHTKRHSYASAASTWATTSTSIDMIDETKKRFPANPYFGFGAVGSLNPTQLAILTAIGITR